MEDCKTIPGKEAIGKKCMAGLYRVLVSSKSLVVGNVFVPGSSRAKEDGPSSRSSTAGGRWIHLGDFCTIRATSLALSFSNMGRPRNTVRLQSRVL